MTCKSISVLRSIQSLTCPFQLENLQAVEKEEVCGTYLCLQQLQLFLFHIPGSLREKEKNCIIFFVSVQINPMHTKHAKVRSFKGQAQLTATMAWAARRSLHRPHPKRQSCPMVVAAIAAFGTHHETDQATTSHFHAGQEVILFDMTLTSIWVNSQEMGKQSPDVCYNCAKVRHIRFKILVQQNDLFLSFIK